MSEEARLKIACAELKELRGLNLTESGNKLWLQSRIQLLEGTIAGLEATLAKSQELFSSAPSSRASAALAAPAVATYAWDQFPGAVTIYHSIANLTDPSVMTHSVTASDRSVSVLYTNKETGQLLRLSLGPLFAAIDADGVVVKLKPGKASVRIPKATKAQWTTLLAAEGAGGASRGSGGGAGSADPADPSGSLMNVIKNLYDSGDDDMKRTLSKAMYEAQSKRNDPLPDVADMMRV